MGLRRYIARCEACDKARPIYGYRGPSVSPTGIRVMYRALCPDCIAAAKTLTTSVRFTRSASAKGT